MVKRRTAWITVSVASLLLVIGAPAAQADHNSVTGTARHLGADPPFPAIQVHVNAFADALGLNPRGQMRVDAPDIHSYTGDVTCLNVFGNQSTVGIRITKSSDPSLIGQGELWRVVDSQVPANPDLIAGFAITADVPVVCPPLFFDVPVVSGNYVVHQATQ
jgi:hypothetical protein